MVAAFPDDGTAFVLLDDGRSAGAAPARLYTSPVEIIVTRKGDEVPAALEALKMATAGGLHAAGFLAYEAGHALEPKLGEPRAPNVPLLWFGLFRDYVEIAPGDIAARLPPAGTLGLPRPVVDRISYGKALAAVQAHIVAGDIYQANLTFPAHVDTRGHPLALYAAMRARSGAGYGAIVFTGTDWLVSLSPELFFECEADRLTARPMKGTAPRDPDPVRDAARAQTLSGDPKQRAENLMIVDLLRNDLARVAVPGSVAVPELFTVEQYPTVHQMTSTVTATLNPASDAVDTLAALFPCGSITGAPKLRAMEITDTVEQAPRGAYCGSIGRIDAGGRAAAFNVAIRTLHLTDGQNGATMGLGSGIVADSNADDEWAECLAKGRFVAPRPVCDLIETMAFTPEGGLLRLAAHLARMKASAAALDFAFDRHAARNDLQAATFRLRAPAKVRLLLAAGGATTISVSDMPEAPHGEVDVELAEMGIAASDWRLRHKTSDRGFYDDPRRQSRGFEVLFTDASGFLTEGSFTTLFVRDGGGLLTPPLARGVLPGILRGELIESGRAVEADLRPRDLSHGFLIGNALRGLLPARLARL